MAEMERLVDLIYNNENGKFYTDHDLLDNKTDDEIFNLRRELQIDILENTPKYACAYCKTRLYLRGNSDKVHYFCHIKRNPDCPIEVYPKWPLEKLKAYIYNGARESPLHKTMKESLEKTLIKDSRFSEIHVETTISNGSSWRKPDLQANFNDKKYVFEIQISNTFLSVIVARELFYRDMDIPLIWIFGEFEKRDIHFFEKDIFYHHNGNLFIFDEETYKKSIESNALLLKVFYLIPRYENGYVFSLWCDKPAIIDFSEIKFDKDKDNCIRAFYKNFDKHYEFIEVKGKLFDYIKSKEGIRINNDEIKEYFQAFHKYGFTLWENWYDLNRLRLIIITFLSIEDNTVYGYEYNNYKSLIHHVFHSYYDIYWIINEFMKQKDYLDKILSIDYKGTIKKDISSFLNDNNYSKKTKYNQMITYLFEDITLDNC
jgi:hypothetical protein